MAYDYAKLNGRIIEICGTKSKFAKLMGLSERTVSLKLNNKIMFKQDEIMKASNILKISIDEIQKYFFVLKV
jgi:transcriptional regulator with XRE-family HTH domain